MANKKRVNKNSIHYKGGMALKEKYGSEHFSKMAKKRWSDKKALENK